MICIRDVQDERLYDWVHAVFRDKINLEVKFDPKKCATKAIDRDKEELLAVVVFHDYLPNHRMEMSIASVSPKWATRKVLFDCFNYCFNICKVNRIYTQVMASNQEALEMNRRLGFKELEALPEFTQDLSGDLHDCHVFTMNKNECRWI